MIATRTLLKQGSLRRPARRIFGASQHGAKLILIQNRHAEFARLVEFRACLLASQHVISLLAHRTGHVAAGVADERGGFVAGERRQRAGKGARG